MKIQFFGAAQRVTGSKHLITSPDGMNILLDCGLFQGINTSEDNLNFGFNPIDVDVLLLSHAHIDHAGLIPRLVKKGFRGQIYCTAATKSLCDVMLRDSARIQEKDLQRVNERRTKRGEEALEELYDEMDVDMAMDHFEVIQLEKSFFLDENTKVTFYNAGHVLGSAGIYIEFLHVNKETNIYFTGDIGRPNDKILLPPSPFPQADYIICESTYGDRLHDTEVDMKARLLEIVNHTCVYKGGKVIIPAFAVDRTQELIYALDQLASEKRLPRIPVFVDSPLSVNATQIMKSHKEDFNPEILDYISKDGDAFGFDNLHYVTEVNESKKINTYHMPCIIISASGMAEAGRIKHHIYNNIENSRNTILIVGYCSSNSLGYAIKSGQKTVKIFGDEKAVNAEVVVMDSFSAHADRNEMIDLLKCQNPKKVKKLFLVHGELETQEAFKGHLEEAGFTNVYIPKAKETIELI
ncbi:MAG: MBL fold metallo-hydrolase RNA specificity domain-containing protein [Leadbetterella sp.]